MWRWIVGAVVVVGLAVGGALFLMDDDDDGDSGDGGDAATETTLSDEQQVFVADGVPFTFEYPPTFAPADTLPAGYLAILGIDPINFIDVRLTADEEIPDEQIAGDIGAALETETTDVLGTSTREYGGVQVISFEVADNSGAEQTISRLNFFRAGGRTWELGCQSNTIGAAVIDDACDAMLATLTITG